MRSLFIFAACAVLFSTTSLAYDLSEIDGDDNHGDAFVLKGWEPSELPLKWAVPKDNVPETGITTTTWYNVVQASFQSWEDVATSIVDFEPDNQYGNAQGIYELTDSQDPATYDTARTEVTYVNGNGVTVIRGVPPAYDGRLNMVVCVTEGGKWASFSSSALALAVTVYAYIPSTRYIVGGDIFMNCDNFDWEVTSGAPTPSTFDLQNTLTHEVGHFIGMGHPTSTSRTAATMFASAPAGETDKRSLEQDDMNGATYLYPAVGAALISPDNNLMGLRDPSTGLWTNNTTPINTGGDGGGGGGGGCTIASKTEQGGSLHMMMGFLLSFLPLLLFAFHIPQKLKRTKVAISALVLALLLPACAQATIVVRMNIMELTMMAKRVVHGQITNKTTTRVGGMVFTNIDLVVHEPLKGTGETHAKFRIPGGVVGDYGVRVPGTPNFKMNEEVVVFLEGDKADIVCGMAQGKFAIERPKGNDAFAVQDTRGLCLLDARGPAPNEEGGPATAWTQPIKGQLPLTGSQAMHGQFIRGSLLKVPLNKLFETIKSFDPTAVK